MTAGTKSLLPFAVEEQSEMTLSRRGFLRASGVVAAATAVAGCSGGSGGGGGDTTDGGGSDAVKETTEVAMTGSQFQPRNIHVDAGATVTWTNEDGYAHTVTAASDNWSFDEEVSGGGSVSHTFENSGVYDVYCKFHGSADLTGMSMKIAVGDATIEDPLGGGGGDETTTEGGGGGVY